MKLKRKFLFVILPTNFQVISTLNGLKGPLMSFLLQGSEFDPGKILKGPLGHAHNTKYS